MSRQFLVPIDLAQNELQNGVVQNLAAAPTSPTPKKGQLYMNSSDNTLYWYDGSGWVASKGGSGTPTGAAGGDLTGSYPNPTIGAGKVLSTHFAGSAYGSVIAETSFGQPTDNGSAATVSKSDHTHGSPLHSNAAHSSIPLSALAVPTADVDMNGRKVINVGAPVSANDAANKTYVDGIAQGLDAKASVRLASTGSNLGLSGLAAIDTITPSVGDRILVKNQTLPEQNGIYYAQSGAWIRSTDMDSWSEVPSAFVFVEQGVTNQETGWVCTSDTGGVIGTSPMVWTQFSGAGSIVGGAGLTQTGNQLDVVAGDASLVVSANSMVVGYAGSGSAVTAAHSDHTHTANTRVLAQGCAAATSTIINHSFGTRDVAVKVYRNSAPYDEVECDVESTDIANVTVRFAVAPAAAAFRIVVMG